MNTESVAPTGENAAVLLDRLWDDAYPDDPYLLGSLRAEMVRLGYEIPPEDPALAVPDDGMVTCEGCPTLLDPEHAVVDVEGCYLCSECAAEATSPGRSS